VVKLLILLKSHPLERKKNEKRGEKGTRIGHMTNEKGVKTLRSVAAFISKAESMKLFRSERSGTSFGENI